ncbi:MAG: sugar transferase [Candidatus Sulfotelmatobacter sp.]
MSSLPINPRQQPPGIEWAARLIPGVASPHSDGKKPPRSTRVQFLDRDAVTSLPFGGEEYPNSLAPILPGEGRQRENPATWLLTDFALVMLEWMLMAKIYLRLQGAFWHLPTLPILLRTSGVLRALIGIAFLHGLLINLLDRRESSRFGDGGLPKEMWTMGKAVFLRTLALSVTLLLQDFSMPVVTAVWSVGLLHFGMLWGRRRVERKSDQHCLRIARGMRNVLIVGAGPVGRRIASYMGKHPEMDRSVCGFLDDRKPLGNGVLGRTKDLIQLARTGFVDEVILAPPHDQDTTLRVLHTARQLRLDVKMAPHLFGYEPKGQSEKIGNIPLISLHAEQLPVARLLLKRGLDVVGAGAALIFLAPALALIAILVKLDSPGPVLYKALRAGRKRRPFHCYKFRTMVRDANNLKEGLREHNQRLGPIFKIANDPRITRIGRFLRRYSLDEFPQLWNVVKGEMSLVGPRPHPLEDVSTYAIEYLPRLDVVPGMTGLWQIAARRNPSFQTGMNLDVEYIRHWSVGMDLLILWKTAGAVLRGSGE